MDETLKIALGALAGGLISGGAIIKLGFGALVNSLRAEFATQHDLDGVGSRVNALETVAIAAKDTADNATDRVALMEERARNQWERTMETLDRVSKTMEKVSGEQKIIATQHAEMARDLKHLFKRLDGNQPRREE